MLGVDEALWKRTPEKLSGGEKRRAAIAGVLAMKPEVFVLDEPFAGVDPIAVEDIQHIVWRLKYRNIGILITDHNLALSVHFMILNPHDSLLVLTANMLFILEERMKYKEQIIFFIKMTLIFLLFDCCTRYLPAFFTQTIITFKYGKEFIAESIFALLILIMVIII